MRNKERVEALSMPLPLRRCPLRTRLIQSAARESSCRGLDRDTADWLERMQSQTDDLCINVVFPGSCWGAVRDLLETKFPKNIQLEAKEVQHLR